MGFDLQFPTARVAGPTYWLLVYIPHKQPLFGQEEDGNGQKDIARNVYVGNICTLKEIMWKCK